MAQKKTRVGQSVLVFVIFLCLEVISFALVSFSSEANNLFLVRTSREVSGFFYNISSSISEYLALKDENDRLEEHNAAILNAIYHPSDTASARFAPAAPYSFKSAEIIGTRSASHHNYFIINKGSKDGITAQMGVITGRGVVGIVDAVGLHTSFVRSLQSFGMNVSARLGKQGPVGPVEWAGKDSRTARMDNIPIHYTPTQGDTVYTSGYSAIFPPDIPLGTVQTSSTQNGLSTTVELTLFEDFSALRHVIVVQSDYYKELNSHE